MMERMIIEFEPRIRGLFSETNVADVDVVQLAMDYLEDLAMHGNQLTPNELLNTDRYHSLRRITVEQKVYAPFCRIIDEFWNGIRGLVA